MEIAAIVSKTRRCLSMEEMVELLAEYQWVYNFKLTRFFADRVWERIPQQWNEMLLSMPLEELNNLPIGSVKESWPASFKYFISQCMDHSLSREQTLDIKTPSGVARVAPLDAAQLGPDIRRGMSEKKLHEVCHMTGLIDHVTRMAGNQRVVDVGSGLGYLGQALHRCYGHQVLGLEGKQCHTSGAEKRSTQTVRCSGLQNVQCELHQNTQSRAEFLAVLQSWFQSLPPDGSLCDHQTGSKSSAQTGPRRVAKKSKHKSKLCSNSDTSQESKASEELHQISGSTRTTNQQAPEDVCEKNDELTELVPSFANVGLNDGDKNCDKCNATDDDRSESMQMTQGNCKHTLSLTNVDDDIAHDRLNTFYKKHSERNDLAQVNNCSSACLDKNKDFDILETARCNAGERKSAVNKSEEKQFSLEHNHTSTGKVRDEEISAMEKTTGGRDLFSGVGILSIRIPTPENKSRFPVEKTGLYKEPAKDETELCQKPAKDETEMYKDPAKDVAEVCKKPVIDQTVVYKEPVKDHGGVCMVGLHCCGDLTPTMLRYFVEVECVRGLCCVSCCYHRMKYDVCMVGLHCCGDLTPTMLRYFVEVACVRGLCCVSCCYHRMKYDEATSQFENFPMSRCVQEVMSHVSSRYPGWSLNTYAMRLAAQETRARWLHQSQEDHDFHTRNVAYRALLELCLEQGPYMFKKTARKLAHRKDHTSYEQYVDTVARQIEFSDTDGEGEPQFKQHMMTLYRTHQQCFSYIEPFTALQFLLQPVLESLIYTDRQLWLQEHGYHANIIPIFDEFLSPRNLALIAIKC